MKYKMLELLTRSIAALISAVGYTLAYVYIGVLWIGTTLFFLIVYLIALPFTVLRMLWETITTGKCCHGLNISITTKEQDDAKDG